jgi:hypothetical protein
MKIFLPHGSKELMKNKSRIINSGAELRNLLEKVLKIT